MNEEKKDDSKQTKNNQSSSSIQSTSSKKNDQTNQPSSLTSKEKLRASKKNLRLRKEKVKTQNAEPEEVSESENEEVLQPENGEYLQSENPELTEEPLIEDEENREVSQSHIDDTTKQSETSSEDQFLDNTDEATETLADSIEEGGGPSKPHIAVRSKPHIAETGQSSKATFQKEGIPSKHHIAETETRQRSKATFQKEPVKHPVIQQKKQSMKSSHKKRPGHYTYRGSTKLLIFVTMLGIILGGGAIYFGNTNFQNSIEFQKNQTALQKNFLKEVVTKENYTLHLRKEILEKEEELKIIRIRNVSRLLKKVRSNDRESLANEVQLRRATGRVGKSCRDISILLQRNISGVYFISPVSNLTKHVYCDMEADEGGWTVIQKRVDGSVIFGKGILEYISGFGDGDGSYFLGLEHIHALVETGRHTLRIELEDFDRNKVYAQYSSFYVGNRNSTWELRVSGYSGTAGDSLLANNGTKFSTYDSDHDNVGLNCGLTHYGGWWFTDCGESNLNGLYVRPGETATYSIIWTSWSKTVRIKKMEMKIRPTLSKDVKAGGGT